MRKRQYGHGITLNKVDQLRVTPSSFCRSSHGTVFNKRAPRDYIKDPIYMTKINTYRMPSLHDFFPLSVNYLRKSPGNGDLRLVLECKDWYNNGGFLHGKMTVYDGEGEKIAEAMAERYNVQTYCVRERFTFNTGNLDMEIEFDPWEYVQSIYYIEYGLSNHCGQTWLHDDKEMPDVWNWCQQHGYPSLYPGIPYDPNTYENIYTHPWAVEQYSVDALRRQVEYLNEHYSDTNLHRRACPLITVKDNIASIDDFYEAVLAVCTSLTNHAFDEDAHWSAIYPGSTSGTWNMTLGYGLYEGSSIGYARNIHLLNHYEMTIMIDDPSYDYEVSLGRFSFNYNDAYTENYTISGDALTTPEGKRALLTGSKDRVYSEIFWEADLNNNTISFDYVPLSITYEPPRHPYFNLRRVFLDHLENGRHTGTPDVPSLRDTNSPSRDDIVALHDALVSHFGDMSCHINPDELSYPKASDIGDVIPARYWSDNDARFAADEYSELMMAHISNFCQHTGVDWDKISFYDPVRIYNSNSYNDLDVIIKRSGDNLVVPDCPENLTAILHANGHITIKWKTSPTANRYRIIDNASYPDKLIAWVDNTGPEITYDYIDGRRGSENAFGDKHGFAYREQRYWFGLNTSITVEAYNDSYFSSRTKCYITQDYVLAGLDATQLYSYSTFCFLFGWQIEGVSAATTDNGILYGKTFCQDNGAIGLRLYKDKDMTQLVSSGTTNPDGTFIYGTTACGREDVSGTIFLSGLIHGTVIVASDAPRYVEEIGSNMQVHYGSSAPSAHDASLYYDGLKVASVTIFYGGHDCSFKELRDKTKLAIEAHNAHDNNADIHKGVSGGHQFSRAVTDSTTLHELYDIIADLYVVSAQHMNDAFIHDYPENNSTTRPEIKCYGEKPPFKICFKI